MIKKIAFLLLFGSLSIAATAQTRVRLNMLEKSPLSNMIVVTKNDSTARYTKLIAGTGVTIAYNEADTTLTLSATASAGNTDEQTLTFDPATGNLSISNGNTVNLTEGIQDAVANMLVAGTNVTLTYNDGAGTLTIAASGAGGGASDLGSLTDVDTTGKANGYVLAYNSATSTWEAQDNTLSIDSTGRVFTIALGGQEVSFEDQVGLTSVRLADLVDTDTTGEATGSILLYDATSGNWEAQANSIDNLTDGYKFNGNIVLGRPFVRKPTSVDYGNIFIGAAAGPDSLLGYANIAIGQDVFRSFIADPISQGNANIAIGEQAMNKTLTGFQNVAIGRQALKGNLTGSENLALGRSAGYNNFGEPDNILTNYNQGVYIGTHATPRDTFSTNELVFGYNAVGNGSNTATLGNNNITETYLKGTTNLRGYGAGNKEATDLTKTRSRYIAAFATDGTLLELDTTGLFGGGSGTPQTLSFSESTRELTISDGNTVDLSEGIQEEMNSTLVAGTGITITYDDGAGTLTVAAPAGSGNTDEQTLSLDNATAVLSISNGNSVDLSEAIDNQVNTLTVAGTNIAKVYSDGANTLTLSTTDALTAIDAITFDANTTSEVANRLQFNTDYNTLTFGMANATPIRIGQDLGWLVKNQTGTTIAKGVAVMAVGTVGASGRILIDELVADGSVDAHYFLGVTAESIADGADGFVASQGHIRGINTSAFPGGTVLYASPTTPGAFTATEPTGNDLKLPLAFVVNSDASNGEIVIRADPGASIKDLHDVDVTGIANNSILKYNSASQVWAIGTDNSESTTASNGLTLSGVDVKLGGTLTEATTITMAGNDMTFTGTTGSDILIDLAGSTTINSTNASGYNSSLILDGVSPRLLADAKTTEPLNMIEFMGGRSGVKEMTLSSQVSNDNTTYTAMYFNPTRVSLKTPNVTDLTAQNGQFLQLVDRLTGEIEFASALSAEVDGSVTNEGSLSVTAGTGTTSVINSNTSGSAAVTLEASTGLSIGEAGNTITLTNTAPDQTVSLTGAGITAISGTYPNFTITSTEVDGSVTNEIQTMTATDGITATATGNDYAFKLGGTTIDEKVTFTTNLTGSIDFQMSQTNEGFRIINQTNKVPFLVNGSEVKLGTPTHYTWIEGTQVLINYNQPSTSIEMGGTLQAFDYGEGNKEAADLSKTASAYVAGFATDGTLIDFPTSTFVTSATNGLTKQGNNLILGGTLTSPTTITLGSGNAFTIAGTNTGLVVNQTTGIVGLGGTVTTTNYGQNNMEASDLGKTFSGNYAGFADDGTVIEVNALPISTGTSGAISWANLPQRIHVLDFGANTSITLSFTNVRVGGIYTLRVTGNSGTDTLVWPGTAKFEDGTSAGTVTLQDGGQMFTFYWDGTNYWVK